MKKYIVLSALMLLFVIYSSCTKAVIDEGGVIAPIDTITIVTYESKIKDIMFNHCITCHGGPTPNGDIGLGNYEAVRFYTESGNLVARINDIGNPMPPNGLMSEDKRQLIAKWVEDGYLEN